MSTVEGRYQSIAAAPAGDCNQFKSDSAGNSGAAIAIGAAAVLGAIALSHKSHHHEDNQHYEDQTREGDYERGYRDGLYNQSYHNYDRSDSYSNGYTAGVRQRGHETSYQDGYGSGGGYSSKVYVNDLVGESKGSANDALGQRGFQVMDTDKTEYEGRYVTWWREASGQCIVVNLRDSHVYSVQNVKSRNCR